MDAGRRHFKAPPTCTNLDVRGAQNMVEAETEFPPAASHRPSEFHSWPAAVDPRATRCHQSNIVTTLISKSLLASHEHNSEEFS